VRLFARSGTEWTDRLPAIAEAFAALSARSAQLDGELWPMRTEPSATTLGDLFLVMMIGYMRTMMTLTYPKTIAAPAMPSAQRERTTR
jgi:hypothetical protein